MEKQGLTSKTKIRIAVSAGLLLILILMLIFSLSSVEVSEEFKLAREDAAQASEEISIILNDSVENLALIARYEREENINDARDLTQEEIDKADARNQAALNLATAVQKMAESAQAIKSETAKQKVVEASSFQVTAITHILKYNSLLNALLTEINAKFSPRSTGTEERIEELLTELNEEAEKINELNENFTQALREFDSIVGFNYNS
jgi:ABC-type transport system involved in Fe-S cluster assembly fused permease/ATPase subunit